MAKTKPPKQPVISKMQGGVTQSKQQTAPTNEQIGQLGSMAHKLQAAITQHGPINTDEPPKKISMTVEDGLKKIEELYAETMGLFEKAKEKDDDLIRRLRKVKKEEEDLTTKDIKLKQQEDLLQEKEIRLFEREINEEQGFRTEKSRIFKPLEDERNRLTEELQKLEAEIAEQRTTLFGEARVNAKDWTERLLQETEARTKIETEARIAFEESLEKDRQIQLSKLRTELNAEREKTEAIFQKELDQQRTELDFRKSELDSEAQMLEKMSASLRKEKCSLTIDQELLSEDKTALERKVERLVAEHTENMRHETGSLRMQLEDARNMRDNYFREIESIKELNRRFGDRPPEQIVMQLATLESERNRMAQELRERPDARAAERLSELEQERSIWLEEKSVLVGDLAKAKGELTTRRLAAIELETLKKETEALEVHKQLLDGAVNELRVQVKELTNQDENKNPLIALTTLDENEDLNDQCYCISPISRTTPSLREFAEDLRHRIAEGVSGRKLYYSEHDIRAFLGGLALNARLMILQGISGTGKTSLPLAFASAVGAGIEIVEVQAGWRDRQDLVGYYNAFHRHYYATNFLQALYKAGTPAYKDRLFMMVLDEINLSRPEQFFADFLSALEQPMNERRITLLNDPVSNGPQLMVEGRHLSIPPNVWFIGTANHDESTAEFADKTYDRAHVMEMPRKTDDAHFNIVTKAPRSPISYSQLDSAFDEAVIRRESDVRKATEWLRKSAFTDSLEKRFRVGWGNRLENQLARYLPVILETGGSKGEAMDHLLATKVLRKLKDRHDIRATALDDLRDQIETAWLEFDYENTPKLSLALIKKEIDTKKNEEM